MQLLRDQRKVGIISGNSEEEQIPRIVKAITEEMNDDISGLQNLTFYVNGGATKIYFDKICNSQLGIRPNSLALEREIIKQELIQFNIDNIDNIPLDFVAHELYLISSQWLNEWKTRLNFNSDQGNLVCDITL